MLAHLTSRIVAASLASLLMHGSAAVTIPQPQPSEAAPQALWTHGARSRPVERPALDEQLIASLLQRPPAPAAPQPGGWALLLAGLIGVAAIARRRAASMRYRTLAFMTPGVTAAPRPQPERGAPPQLAAQPRNLRRMVYCLAGLLMLPAHARAEDVRKVTPFLEETVTNDDNVYRISDSLPPATVIGAIGSNSRSDTYHTTSVGVSADLPVSLQRFLGSFTFNSTRYQRFSALDFDGHELRGSWQWQASKDLRGELGISDSYTLASFAQLLSTTPDRLKLRQEFVNGAWMFIPGWRVRAAGDRLEQRNSDPNSLFNDVTIDGFEASLSRVSPVGNSIGVSTRIETGHFPHAEPLAASLIDNNYRQYSVGLLLDWRPSPLSHLTARFDQVDRRFDQLPQRNRSEPTARAEFDWTPTGKVAVTAIAERDISPYEYIRSSIVVITGLIVHPAWRMTEKLELSADLEAFTRSYLADPAQALGLVGERIDKVRIAGGQLTYNPFSILTVRVNLRHEARTSNVAFGDYGANVAWLSVRLAF